MEDKIIEIQAPGSLQEKVILVAVKLPSVTDAELDYSLRELRELVRTAGAETIGVVTQAKDRFDSATYVGSGKIDEIKMQLLEMGATGIICDDELSPAQLKNLGKLLETKVMDRTMLILDIFAAHARTGEGKIQVELAQLRYQLSRLSGYGTELSRLGGGIGTRGPGEKKLEQDRRVIKNRISQLKSELADVVEHREINRLERKKKNIPVAAIVGYTNAGKSTLLNALTDAGILAENKLFATLDTTTRELLLPGKQQVLLTDTVGFIRKLPTELIKAFRSTLEEAKYADYIINVVDASDPESARQMQTVYETLDMLEIRDKKILTIFNKMDLVNGDERLQDPRSDYIVRISAKTGEGLTDVKEALLAMMREEKQYIEVLLPFSNLSIIADIRKKGELLLEEYRGDGVFVKAFVPAEIAGKLLPKEKKNEWD